MGYEENHKRIKMNRKSKNFYKKKFDYPSCSKKLIIVWISIFITPV
jgi:hypothetical protein